MVYDICQDSSGLIWLATYEGICCYDGFKFMNYNAKDGLPEQKYKHILYDDKGVLWCIPLNLHDTLIYYKDNVFKRLEPDNKANEYNKSNDFDVIYKDNDPVICVGSDNGLYVYKDKIWNKITISDKHSNNIVTRVIGYKDKFYFSTCDGIYILDANNLSWKFDENLERLPGNILTFEFQNKGLSDEKIWVLCKNLIGYYESGKFIVFIDNLNIPDFPLTETAFLRIHKNCNIFFGNNWAKYYLEKNNRNIYPLMNRNGFLSNGALSIFIDKEDNIWFADTRGLDKLYKLSHVNYYEFNGMLENEVTAICEMNDGRFVLGHTNGLSVLGNDNKFKRIPFDSEILHSSRVHDMMKDKDGNVWFVATELGVGKMDSSGNIKWYKSSNKALYYSISQDISGRIWVGTTGSKNNLYYIKDDKLVEFERYKEINNSFRRIIPSDKGGIYIVGARGLWYIDDNTIKKIHSRDGMKSENVYAYYKNKSGEEFVGTANGLYSIDNGIIVKYAKNGVNISKPVYFIIQDNDGNYWIGTNDGVIKLDGEGNTEIFNMRNGLAGHETNRAAGIVDSKGRVWIGTDLGLSCYMSDFNRTKPPVPKILLYDLEDSKGVQYYLDDNSTIPYIDNTLNFNFRGISFVNEDLLVYRYKLEGYDKDWQEIKQSLLDKVKYVNVDPGEYRFCVMAKNFSGEWSEVKKSGIITIESPFYKTWWFSVLILLIFGVMVASLVKIKDQQVQNEKLEKEIKYRKRIEQDLSDSKRKYQDIVNLLPEAIFEFDTEGYLSFANDYGLKLLELSEIDLNHGIKIEEFIVPSDLDSMIEYQNKVLDNKPVSRTEYTFTSRNGNNVPLSINAVPIIKEGNITGIRTVAVDMSEHKKIEDALIKYADDLKILNASKDKFFSIVAHDLKNPFQGLLGFSDFLHSDYDNLSEDEKKEYIGYIRSTSRNAYNLLDNLLQWSRLQTGRIEIVPAKINLFSAVNSVMDLLTSNAIRKRITLLNSVCQKIFVLADNNMLNSVLQNLISNAIKFTRQNGEVRIESELVEGFVRISVTDNGVGMNENDMAKLFKIDQHISHVGTMNETGTGLGLLLCKEMVELNGGNISVQSEAGKGSVFIITMPIAPV